MKQARVFTVTANPALDLSGHVREIVLNEKNYVYRHRADPGGNGINAARIASRLGADVTAWGFVGGSAGQELKKALENEGVAHDFISIQEATRTNVTVTNDGDHQQTRLTFPGPKIKRPEISRLLAKAGKLRQPAILVVGGSTPEGCPRDFYLTLIEKSTRAGIGVIVDVPSKHLKPLLRKTKHPLLMIKPNLVELEELSGKKLRGHSQIAKEALHFTKKAAIVCVSLGGEGGIFALSSGNAWLVRSPKVKTRGSVGAGDSMVGAIATMLARSLLHKPTLIPEFLTEELAKSFAFGLAAGAATAEVEGTALASAKRITQIFKKSFARDIVMRHFEKIQF